MGWLNKIFKGSAHKILEGHNHGKYRDDKDALSEYEKEHINQAIALSLLEEEQKKEDVSDNGSHDYLEEDEQFARALQESLNVESPPRENGRTNLPLPFTFVTGLRICAGCNSEIHGRFLSCMSAVWHPECFCCNACKLPITDYEFSMQGNQPYHKSCYKELYHPRCDVCNQFIPTNSFGLIEYRAHPFWLQKYCPSHEHDGTPRCCSCERMEPREAQYVSLDDGRKLCLECLDSAIMDTNECHPLHLDILEFYEGLNMKVKQQIPLLLVERQALNEAMEGEKNVKRLRDTIRFHSTMSFLLLEFVSMVPEAQLEYRQQNRWLSILLMILGGNKIKTTKKNYISPNTFPGIHHHLPETRGLCLSEEQTVSTILRRPIFGFGNRVVEMMTEPYKLIRRCEVTAILVLYGLPRLLTGSILAHEMMHAWLRLNGYATLRPEVEEGICQVLAHMWLDSEIFSGSGSHIASSSSSSSSSTSSKKGTRSQFERKLGDFFKHQIESDTSAAYGDGFRVGNEAVLRYGLRQTLDHIKLTGSFPF